MRETEADLRALQALLESSIARAGAFLRESFQMPEHSLSAEQLVAALQGMRTVALATATARGEPRVAPIGAFFFCGHFYIPTVAAAARARHIAARPAISLTLYEGNGFAVIAHGHAELITPQHAEFDTLEALQRELSGQSVREWGEGIYLRIEPEVLYTYGRDPARPLQA